jgi:hypothetical protein
MAWRIVEQPNGKLARFSDVVDDFTHYDMTDEEAKKMCREEYGMGILESEDKVKRARDDKTRWSEEIATVRTVHGHAVAETRIAELST